MKFEKVKPGMVLYDVHSTRMGNTTMRTLGTWTVKVLSVDSEKRQAKCSWNGNPPTTWQEGALARLKEKPPILIASGMGYRRRPNREERAAILASGSNRTTWSLDEVQKLMAARSAE